MFRPASFTTPSATPCGESSRLPTAISNASRARRGACFPCSYSLLLSLHSATIEHINTFREWAILGSNQ
ncbi:MAG: hypothetical protein QOI73_1359 [Solirubrobacteraceae bacterium]|nr:hypothetical protein [Solirubrobacteraceae bacterium]